MRMKIAMSAAIAIAVGLVVPAMAGETVNVAWKFQEGQRLNYMVDQSLAMEGGGGGPHGGGGERSMKGGAEVSITGEEQGAALSMRTWTDSMTMGEQEMPKEQLAQMERTMDFSMNEKGELMMTDGSGAAPGLLTDLFFPLPNGELEKGKPFERPWEMQNPKGPSMTGTATFTLEEVGKVDGVDAATYAVKYALNSTQENPAAPGVKQQIDIEGNGKAVFAHKAGHFLSSDIELKVHMKAKMPEGAHPGGGGTMEMKQTQKVSTRFTGAESAPPPEQEDEKASEEEQTE